MVDIGWVKLHRKLMSKGYYKKSEIVHLWIHILLRANHKPKEHYWNKENIIIQTGQFITGRKKLSEETGINESMVERILKILENEQQIEQQKTTKFRLITVKNWVSYQIKDLPEQQIEQQVNNKRTTDEQQVNTNNNDNKENNEKNEEEKRLPPVKTPAELEFENFWNLYNKKVGSKEKILKKFLKLSEVDRNKIFETLPEYLKSTPDKQYRKHPETYLNNHSWNDEIIKFSKNGTTPARRNTLQSFE